MSNPINLLTDLIIRYPILESCREDIFKAYEALIKCYEQRGKVLICGNGGSAADADHIAGELMKGFLKKREISGELKKSLIKENYEMGSILADKLQGSLPAIVLTSQTALVSAVLNDINAEMVFAQQVLGYAKPEDILIGLSTSGSSKNVLYAIYLAKILGMTTIGFTGLTGGKMKSMCDILISVQENTTMKIQELHLPIYHVLCAMVEEYFF